MSKSQNSLVMAIVFASVVISGSLIFFATQLSGSGIDEKLLNVKVQEGIEEYQFNEAYPLIMPKGADEDNDAVIGDKNAPVTIVEFSDYECPYCGAFFNSSYQTIKENYIDTGKVKLVFRDLPLDFHPNAAPAAVAAECARSQSDDETYFAFHDKLFEGGSQSLSTSTYLSYARDLNLDINEFTTCLDDPKMAEEVQADKAYINSYGINGTPAFLIEGRYVSGNQKYMVFEYIIERALDEKGIE